MSIQGEINRIKTDKESLITDANIYYLGNGQMIKL